MSALVACGFGGPEGTISTPPVEPRRALWVLCEGSERVLEDPARVERLIAEAHALGATDLFVQVYRGGRAWFASERADAGPHRAMLEAQGRDPLAALLERADAAGLRVHAWVNVLSLASNRDAPVLAALGRDAVHVDQRGRSLLDYPELEVPEPDRGWYRMGTPAVYLDPAAPGVAEYLIATFRELVAGYPGLSGLHLDYIRHPDVLPFVPGSRFGVGLEFGYGPATAARFREETGLDPPDAAGRGETARWDAWRREKLSHLVAGIAETARAESPGLEISAAVIPHLARAYLSLYQDWPGWLASGDLDFAVAMLYSRDDRLFGHEVALLAAGDHARRGRVWIGLGTWLFASRPERAVAQIEAARAAGARRISLFSYDSIVSAPELRDALVAARAGEP